MTLLPSLEPTRPPSDQCNRTESVPASKPINPRSIEMLEPKMVEVLRDDAGAAIGGRC